MLAHLKKIFSKTISSMAFLTSVKCEKKYQKFGGYFGILWQLVNAIGDSYIIQMSGKA